MHRVSSAPHAAHVRHASQELEGVGIRLNKQPPNIVVKKKDRGGLNYSTTVKGGELNEEATT